MVPGLGDGFLAEVIHQHEDYWADEIQVNEQCQKQENHQNRLVSEGLLGFTIALFAVGAAVVLIATDVFVAELVHAAITEGQQVNLPIEVETDLEIAFILRSFIAFFRCALIDT